jgi:peptidoglycan hydrolase-like protein with peptidoglycan-binding domain
MKKIITEQLDNAARIVKLQADGYTFVSYRVYDDKLSDSCYCKVGNKFLSRKKKDSSEVCNCFDKEETNSTSNTSNSKYLGKYKGSDILPDFEIKEKNGKLIADNGAGDVELTLVSGNKFKGKVAGFDAEIVFTVSNDVSTGGNVTVAGKTISFTKVSSTPSKPDEPKTEDKSVWSCIENYNKKNNQYPLKKESNYRYEVMDLTYDGRNTSYLYYENHKAVWVYTDTKKPILNGVWECKGNEGYIIKWSDGDVSRFGAKTSEIEGKTNPKITTNTSENPCVNGYKEGCVTEDDILGKGKALKVCSKCDLIKKVQENPEIKARIFRIQKELGQEQKTDNSFGPIMLAAIKEFQQSHGINPTGMVGEKTLSKINPSGAKQFYLDRGSKKFDSDKKGWDADYQKALQILDDGERDGIYYFWLGASMKDNKAACSALIKSMERGEYDALDYYHTRLCFDIPGFPSREDFLKSYKTKVSSGVSTSLGQEPKIDDSKKNQSDNKPTNKPEVKPIYRRSSRQVLSPDDEL